MMEDNQIVIDDDSEGEELVEEECPDCGKVFTDLNELASHYFSAHEAAKRAAAVKKKTLQNQNGSAAAAQNTNSIKKQIMPGAGIQSSGSNSKNTSLSTKQIIPGAGIPPSVSNSKNPTLSIKPIIPGAKTDGKSSLQEKSNNMNSNVAVRNKIVNSDSLSLKQRQLNARKITSQNTIPQGKLIPQGQLIPNVQRNQQPKLVPQGAVKEQSKVQGPVKEQSKVVFQGQNEKPKVISEQIQQGKMKVPSKVIPKGQIKEPSKAITKGPAKVIPKGQIKESSKVITKDQNKAIPSSQIKEQPKAIPTSLPKEQPKAIPTSQVKEQPEKISLDENSTKSDDSPKNDPEEETYTDLLIQYFKENDLPFKPRLRNKSDGNCWYEAIADQVVLHNIKDMPTTHEAVRKAICDALFTLPQTKSWIKNLFDGQKKIFANFVNKHRKNGEWTDAKGLICQATALMLKRNIHIVGTANKGQSVCYTKLESVVEAQNFTPLTVGYYQDQHYHSIEKIEESNLGKISEVGETEKVEGKTVRTPIVTKPLRKMSVEKTAVKMDSTEVLPIPKVEGKTVRQPIASKPLRKVPAETPSTKEKSQENKIKGNTVEERIGAVPPKKEDKNIVDQVVKIERTLIVSKPLRKVSIEITSDKTKPMKTVTEPIASKVDGKVPRTPIVTNPLRKAHCQNSIENKKIPEAQSQTKTTKEPTIDGKVPRNPIVAKPLRKDNGSSTETSKNQNISQAKKIINQMSDKPKNLLTIDVDSFVEETKDKVTNILTSKSAQEQIMKKNPISNVDNFGKAKPKNIPEVSVPGKPIQGKIPQNKNKPQSIIKPSKFSLAARNKLLRFSAIKIQRWFRNIQKGKLVWEEFRKKKRSAIILQKHWRSVLARKKVGKMKAALKIEAWYAKRKATKTKAVISLQSRWKSVKTRKQFLSKKAAAITVQKHCRSLIAKRRVTGIRKSKGAEKIQKWLRNVKAGRVIRKDFLQKKKAATTLQPHWRSWLAQCRGPSFQLLTPDEHIINFETGEVELVDDYIINAETGQLEKTPVDLGDYVNKMTDFMDYTTLSKMSLKTWKKSKLKSSLVSLFQRENPRRVRPEIGDDDGKENIASALPLLNVPTKMPDESIEEVFDYEEEKIYTAYNDQDYLGESSDIFESFLSPLTKPNAPECWVKDEKCEIVDYILDEILGNVFPKPKLDDWFKFSDWRSKNNSIHPKSWLETQVETKREIDKKKAILTLQSSWRGFVVKRSFVKIKSAAVLIQKWFKNIRNGRITKENFLAKKKASVILQSHIRSFLQRRKFLKLKNSAILVQSTRKMILQKRTFDKLKVATLKIQRWYKNIKFAKAFGLFNPDVTSVGKNLKEYVDESDDFVDFSKIREIAIENRTGFDIRTKVFSKFQPQILDFRRSSNSQIHSVEENIDPVTHQKITTVDGLVITSEPSTVEISKKERPDPDACIDDDIEEFEASPSINVNACFPIKKSEVNKKVLVSKSRGGAKNYEKKKIVEQTLDSIIEKVCSQENYLKTLSISEEIDFFNAAQIEKENKLKNTKYRNSHVEIYDHQESNCVDQFIAARKSLITSRDAPVKIQRWLRNIKAGKVLRKEFLRKKKAVTTIQSYRRSLVTRREFETMRVNTFNAATTLQSHWKSLVTRRQFCKKKEATLQIQSWFRIMSVRKMLRIDFMKKKSAVRTIQLYWRDRVARRQLIKTNAATMIQSHWKALVVRKDFTKRKESSIKIQRWFRDIKKGRTIRKEFVGLKRATITVQAHWRGLVAKKKWETRKFSKSIVNFLLEKAVRQNRAAITIQCLWRSWVVRRKFLVKKKTVLKAVTIIQSQWKMHVARKKFRKEKDACVAIQKWRRNLKIGKQQRKEFISKKVSAVKLQSHWRGLLARKKHRALKTVDSIIHDLLEDAAIPRSIAQDILDDLLGNALVPRQSVTSILDLILEDIVRPKVPVRSSNKKADGKGLSKKRSSLPNPKKRKSVDSVPIIQKKKIVEGDTEEIVVVKEVKRRQTDFMVCRDVSSSNVPLQTKTSSYVPSKTKTSGNEFDTINFEQTLNTIKETLNNMKEDPGLNETKENPVLKNIKEDPDIIELGEPKTPSVPKIIPTDIELVETIFKCPECYSSFNDSSEYINHITVVCSVVKNEPIVKVEPETVEELKCDLCDATFSDNSGIEIHRTFFHGGKSLQSDNQKMSKPNELAGHKLTENLPKKGRGRPKKSLVSENPKENETPFATQNLKTLFKDIEQKIKNAKTVSEHATKTDSEPVTKQEKPEPLAVSEHVKVKNETANTNITKKEVPNSDMPKKSETPIQITKCDECGKQRKRKETKKAALVWLLNHRKECSALTNSKPFKCLQCKASFSSNAALSAHKKMCRPTENVKPNPTTKITEPPSDAKKMLAQQLANRLKEIEIYEAKEQALKNKFKRKLPSGDGVEKRKYTKKIKLDHSIVDQ